ncbi:hypothetical protein PUNSTDRAFT_67851 [Punctularia strigosozonata HHB-11173 SS5]|uniref:uncharacterized protein n=1 Tax=Punctularia strigosozonata (strain HHB-11173) TaxID=741275 RepID=UPI000441730C|nr:uncharacterized protein PUNSTDRAFT_67851 [Punctularia strigosozonata HHB-11173 SS5]EIN08911.1 hypothetical protein PUNSTDRAFT_67851 [Punctularia strigosozonata HHB-11173 SS5]
MTFTFAEAKITALFVESIVYGVFLATSFFTFRALVRRRRTPKPGPVRWPFATVAFMLFICGTLNVLMHFKLAVDGLVLYAGTGGPDAGFFQDSGFIAPVHILFMGIPALLGDGMLIYRCYVVYERNWRFIIVPCLLWAFAAASTIGFTVIEARFPNTLNATVTTWTDTFTWAVVGGNPIQSALRAMVESAWIYSVFTMMSAVLASCKSNAVYIFADTSVQLAGVSFNFIIIRVWTNSAVEHEEESSARAKDRESYCPDRESLAPRLPARRHNESGISFDSGSGGHMKIMDIELAAAESDWDLTGGNYAGSKKEKVILIS